MKKSMITPDGGLTITLPPDRVTWFSFLQFSRLATSPDGGWNSKSHWRELGLNRLAPDGNGVAFLMKWTVNSLKANVPKRRQDDFRFDRLPSSNRRTLIKNLLRVIKDHGDNESHKIINSAREDALNGALFTKSIVRDWGRIIGYEIPLAAERPGQLEVDLFAVNDSSNGITIIELKQGKNHKDSPLLALTEAICYGIQTIRCTAKLCDDATLKDHRITDEHFRTIRLILAAPALYWKHWGFSEEDSGRMKGIISRVNEGLKEEGSRLLLDEKVKCELELGDLMPITTPGTPGQ